MSDQPIILRRDPGRDSTASDIARSRGEFRRRPHVEDEAAIPAAPATKRTSAEISPKPVAGSSRLMH
ncbi:MAG: hypothetical protein QOE17_1608 [Gaiellales bacterium]|jgi:hypothetical protein|nr:hypothetical protein [Gaiellales bacterium]